MSFGTGKRRRQRRIGGGLLSRLARDTRGNTLILVAASLLPLLCLVGSGIDMGRGYLAQNRLQQACDAAALAGRRAMSGGVVDNTVRDEATKFFKFNFPVGTAGVDGSAAFDAKGFAPVIGSAANATVTVAAETTLPTTIMKIFGFETLPLSVSCNAKQDFVNTDIALVLDITGSMKDDVSGNAVNGGPTSKMAGLRSAVMALYDQLAPIQTQLEAAGLRLRYTVVPYSSTVNVGDLVHDTSPGYIKDSTSYETRVANYNTLVYVPQGTPVVSSEIYGSTISSANCLKYGYNQPFSGFNPSPAGEPIVVATTLTYYLPATWGGSTNISGNGNKVCSRSRTIYLSFARRYSFTNFSYEEEPVDTSRFKNGQAVTVALPFNDSSTDANHVMGGTMATNDGFDAVDVAANASFPRAIPAGIDANGVLNIPARVGTTAYTVESPLRTTSYSWSGRHCIEERQTVSTITSSSGYSIPSNAYDLDIDTIPNSDATRWAPHWPEMIWYRDSGLFQGDNNAVYPNKQMTAVRAADLGFYACPSEAVRLRAFTRAAMQTYVDNLVPIGGTYHDIGMIWGARFISGQGIFASDNPATFGNMPVSRYIIFLTDGQMAPNADSYTAWGVEYLDTRVTGSTNATNQRTNHIQRLKMICQATKSKNVSIWVIAFATALDASLSECATNPAQASTSSSQADLIAKFTEIGKNIGALRLSQ